MAQARSHGNKPSRGAEIDAEIQREEEEELAKKDAKKEVNGKAQSVKEQVSN